MVDRSLTKLYWLIAKTQMNLHHNKLDSFQGVGWARNKTHSEILLNAQNLALEYTKIKCILLEKHFKISENRMVHALWMHSLAIHESKVEPMQETGPNSFLEWLRPGNVKV